MMGNLTDQLVARVGIIAGIVGKMGNPFAYTLRSTHDDISSYYPRIRETAYPENLKPISVRVWAKLPKNKREYIRRTLPSCARA